MSVLNSNKLVVYLILLVFYSLSCFAEQKDTVFVAHRGLMQFAPENSLLSLQLARERGFKAVEIDVTATQDDNFAVFHDNSLKHRFGRDQEVCSLPFVEIEKLNIHKAFFSEIFKLSEEEAKKLLNIKDSWISKIKRTKVVSLETVFQEFGGSLIYHLDIKRLSCSRNVVPMARKLLALISKYDLFEQVFLESRNLKMLSKLKRLEPKLRLIFWKDNIFEHSEEYLKVLKNKGIDSIDLHWGKIDLQRRELLNGFILHTFTVNVPKRINQLKGSVDYIITDLDIHQKKMLNKFEFFNTQSDKVKIKRDSESKKGTVTFLLSK